MDIFALLLLIAPQRDCVIIVDEGRDSRILQSEFCRNEWPLSELKQDCEDVFRIKIVNRLDFPYRCDSYPALVIGREKPVPLGSFHHSGQAITRLHYRLFDGFEDYASLTCGDENWRPTDFDDDAHDYYGRWRWKEMPAPKVVDDDEGEDGG